MLLKQVQPKIGFDGSYINKYITYVADITTASNPRFALVVVINNLQSGRYHSGTIFTPVFSAIMSGALRIMNIKPNALTIGKN